MLQCILNTTNIIHYYLADDSIFWFYLLYHGVILNTISYICPCDSGAESETVLPVQ